MIYSHSEQESFMNRYRQLLAVSLTLYSAAALGQTVPTLINYQGRLTDNTPAQAPINATLPMKFEIFDAPSAGASLWNETPAGGVAVSGGIFNVALGATTPIGPAVFTGASSSRYLEITLNPGASQEILTPRQRITATGYANLAASANSAVNATTANNATTVTNGVYTTGSYANPAWITSLALTGAITASNLSGTNSGNVTLGAVGAAPNANGATLAGQALTLQPADGSNPGVLTTGTQTIAGNKNFTGNITAANLTPSLGLIFSAGVINTNNLTPFYTTLNGDAIQTTNGGQAGSTLPVGCTFNALYLHLDGITAGANTITATMYKNGVATAMTTSAANPAAGAFVVASDTNPAHFFTVAPGDSVSIGYVQTNSAPISRIGVGTRCQ
jgi:hypothetical protein